MKMEIKESERVGIFRGPVDSPTTITDLGVSYYYLRSIIPFRIFGPPVQVFAVVLRLQGHQNVIPRGGFRVGSICLMIPTT